MSNGKTENLSSYLHREGIRNFRLVLAYGYTYKTSFWDLFVLLGFWTFGILGFGLLGIYRLLGIWTSGHWDISSFRFPGFWTSGFWTSAHLDLWTLCLLGFRANVMCFWTSGLSDFWTFGFLAFWTSGIQVIWIFGTLSTWGILRQFYETNTEMLGYAMATPATPLTPSLCIVYPIYLHILTYVTPPYCTCTHSEVMMSVQKIWFLMICS